MKSKQYYEIIDSAMDYRVEKLEIAKKHGYGYISFAIECMYLYEDLTTTQIGEIFGTTKAFPYHCLSKMNVKMKQHGGARNKNNLKKNDIIYIRNSAEPHKIIAEKFGITKCNVSNIQLLKCWADLDHPLLSKQERIM